MPIDGLSDLVWWFESWLLIELDTTYRNTITTRSGTQLGIEQVWRTVSLTVMDADPKWFASIIRSTSIPMIFFLPLRNCVQSSKALGLFPFQLHFIVTNKRTKVIPYTWSAQYDINAPWLVLVESPLILSKIKGNNNKIPLAPHTPHIPERSCHRDEFNFNPDRSTSLTDDGHIWLAA